MGSPTRRRLILTVLLAISSTKVKARSMVSVRRFWGADIIQYIALTESAADAIYVELLRSVGL